METESLRTPSQLCSTISDCVSRDVLDIDSLVGISKIMAYKIQRFQ